MFIGTLLEKVKLALYTPACLCCGQRLNASHKFCRRCTEKYAFRQPFPLMESPTCVIHAATRFNPAVKKLLYGYKFYNRTEQLPQLTGLLVQYWEAVLAVPGPSGNALRACHPENVLVLPIPPHADKAGLVDRFASRFARHFGYDYQHDVLHWMREVRPQHHIHEKTNRYRNIAQSLRLKSGVISGYEKILVLDDITTTGATLLEASRAYQDEIGTESDCAIAGHPDLINLTITHVPLGSQLRSGESE
jgi:predicted amidophosphoribosyltransferase